MLMNRMLWRVDNLLSAAVVPAAAVSYGKIEDAILARMSKYNADYQNIYENGNIYCTI